MSYTTASLIQVELRASTAFSNSTNPSLATITTWIEEIGSYIDGLASKVYAVTTYTDVFHYGGENFLFLKNTPLVSVTKVEYNSSAEGVAPVWTTLTEYTNYTADLDKGIVILNFTAFNPKSGYNRFRVTYSSGYATIPKNVQMLATKLVASRVLTSLINQNVNERNDGGSISVGDISIVEPASYGVASYKELKADIKDLENTLSGGFKVYRYG